MIYFDNSATTRCCDEAMAVMTEALQNNFGNPSSLHNFGLESENYIKDARRIISKILKCTEKEIYFTSGGTEGNNLALKGGANAVKRRGNHIITTPIEHASVDNPVNYLKKDMGFDIDYVPVDKYGVVDVEALKKLLRPDTVLVSIMLVNNEIGSIQPVEEIGKLVKSNNPECLFHVDAIQGFGKMIIVPKNASIDLLTVSGHKIHGPKGSGFIYINNKVRVVPEILGGGQEYGMRSGTENVPAIAGLAVASKLCYDNLDSNRNHMYELRNHFIKEASVIDGLSINGHLDNTNAPHIISVSVRGVRAEVLLHTLEDRGIFVSAGSACSSNKPAISRTLKAIGLDKELLDSTVRISFCPENTVDEVDQCIKVLNEIIPQLTKYSRK